MKLTKQLILLILSGIMLITVTALLIFMLRSDATAGESTPSSTAGITSTTMPSTAVAAPSGTTAPKRDNRTSNHCSGHGSAHNGTAGDHSSAHYHAVHYGATGDDSAHCAAGDHTATDSGFQ